VGGDVEGERRLAHARPGGEHDQVGLLEAGGELVELAEAAAGTGEIAALGAQLGEAVERLLEQGLHVLEVAGDALVGDPEHDLLGPVYQLGRLADALVAKRGDLGAGPDEAAVGGGVADDLGVMARVCHRRHGRRQGVHDRLAADLVEQAAVGEGVGERDRVDVLAPPVHLQDRLVDRRVRAAVEVARLQELRDDRDGVAGHEHGPEHRLLGVQVLGWDRLLLRRDRHAPGRG